MNPLNNRAAVDFESYYDKEVSITTLGPYGYFNHPQFDPYLVSVVHEDDTPTFVGDPRNFDWSSLSGKEVWSHNASFDESLYLFGVDKNWWPKFTPKSWDCSADLCAYLAMPRSLKGAMKRAFGRDVSKETRDLMGGKRWEDMTPEFQQEVIEYAHLDSEFCLELVRAFEALWPAMERDISRLNRRICRRGLPMSQQGLQDGLARLNQQRSEMKDCIPWVREGKKLLSRPALNEECRKVGIEPPNSLAQDNPEAESFMQQYGDQYPWLRAVRDFRRINAMIKKLESFDFSTSSEGRYFGNLMYFGAQPTGRFSGSGGNLNLQNLTKDELFGVGMRKLIQAKPGKVLIPVDLNQIEVRTLAWLSGDFQLLEEISKSSDIYEVFAVKFGVWSKDKGELRSDPKLRHMVKAMVLGCGYGCGIDRFAEMSGMDYEEAEWCVRTYREGVPKVANWNTGLWGKYNDALQACWKTVNPFRVRLPSGRVLDYGCPMLKYNEEGRPEFTVLIQKSGDKKSLVKLYGGKVAENASQALARDIFSDRMLALDAAGLDIILHVHDEVVLEADEKDAEDHLRKAERIMGTPPDWLPDIPLEAEGAILTEYSKV